MSKSFNVTYNEVESTLFRPDMRPGFFFKYLTSGRPCAETAVDPHSRHLFRFLSPSSFSRLLQTLRRAATLSVVLSGLLFGVLIARVISGVIAEFTSWRVVYYMAIGVQYFVLVGSYFLLPDYPSSKNSHLT
ncbi:hypothetical protein CPB85DRAFT_184760 [Mucidula mucida]|nr:hypothetical protein CPB85DRAFT_184760 [Mucidula mucida]